MRRLLSIALLFISAAAAAQVTGAHQCFTVEDGFGNGIANAAIRLCKEPATGAPSTCTPLASVFSDKALQTPLANPFNADSKGNVCNYYVAPGNYHFQISGPGITAYDLGNVAITDGVILTLPETTLPSTGQAGYSICVDDSVTHIQKCSDNNGAFYARPLLVASGTVTLGTSAINSGACASVVTGAATGVITTDRISWTFNADPTGVTGYAPTSTGSLKIYPYPTANQVNFKVCNDTNGSITPGSVTLNWSVTR